MSETLTPRLLAKLFAGLPIGVAVCNSQRKVIFMNPEARKMAGVDSRPMRPKELSVAGMWFRRNGQTPYDTDDHPFTRIMRREPITHELCLLRNAHRPEGLWLHVSGGPLLDATANRVLGGVLFFTSTQQPAGTLNTAAQHLPSFVAEPHSTQAPCEACLELFAQYRKHNLLLSSAVEQTADSVLITDSTGSIVYVNPAFETTTGYQRDEALGQTPRILKSGKHDANYYKGLWQQLLEGRYFAGTVLNRKKSGEFYWAQQTISPILDGGGSISHFVSVLRDITALKTRQEEEYQQNVAHRVQQRFYRVKVTAPGLDFGGACLPRGPAGGDYFDFIERPDGSLYAAIGDVSGHGFGASLIMAAVRSYLRAYVEFIADPGALLERLNRSLWLDTEAQSYVTMLLVRLDPRDRSITYAGGGHVPCYCVRSSGAADVSIISNGPPLGLFPDASFSSGECLRLDAGDSLVLLTDGVTEAAGAEGEAFGAERAIDLVRRTARLSAKDLARRICEAARRHSGDSPQEDDMTAVVCRL